MKIAVIINDLDVGGAQIMLLKLLGGMNRRQFVTRVISLQQPGEIGGQIEKLGIPVETVNMKPGRVSPLAFLRLKASLRADSPDLVQTWMYHADLLGGLAARLAGIRTVVWGLRNSNLDPGKTKLSTRLVVRLCAILSKWIPQKVLCCSEAVYQIHAAIGYQEDRMVVIPNGFDLERFKPDIQAREAVRMELGLAPNTQVVGLFGRHDAQKDHGGFLVAAGQLHQRMSHVHFILAGPGIDAGNATLMNAARASGIESVVHMLGRRHDMPRLMAALDILVSASTYGEGFPNVLGEAMACGVPCVATDVGDSARIVGDTGKIVRPTDTAGLAHAMEQLLAMPARERAVMGDQARARIAEHYDINDIVRGYESLYSGVGV